ncbi:Crp/Fnr family transcriptional regulator [Rhodomicrobium vannielii ATCC 17100]|nr:Crp/Fnr family transcriptional regulator [Rhodomicrobium vannielii ATCC 17100]
MEMFLSIDQASRCTTCAIRHRSICDALSATEILSLNRIARSRVVPAGQMILGEGQMRTVFANIVSGVVKLTKTLDDGRQHIIGLLFASDFLGRAYRAENPYFAEAATDVELCVFPTAGFERLLAEHPALEHRLFQYTLTELDACQEWMLLLARKKAEERVASFLLMIAKRVPNMECSRVERRDEVHFVLPLSRAEISDCLGLTIETVSRQITRLKTRGVIELVNYREILIPDLPRLQEAAYDAPAKAPLPKARRSVPAED